MAEKQPLTAVTRMGSVCLVLSGLLFVAFVMDVLLDKARIVFGWSLPIRLSDVGEYLALLSAAFFFTVATLLHENDCRDDDSPSDPDRTVTHT